MKNSLKVSFFLAKRGILHGNRSVFFLSAAVIALLFINLLFIPSLLKGASSRVTQQTVGTLTSDVIMIPTYSAKANDQEAILNEIRSRDDVAATTHMLTMGSRVGKGDEVVQSQIYAIDPATYSQVFTVPIVEGSMLEQGKKMTLLGAHIAGRGVASGQLDKTLQGVGVGSDVNLELQGGNVVTLPVSGIFDNDFKQSDSRSLIGFDTAVAVAPQTANRPSTMYIKARDTQSVSELAEALETAYPDYQVQLGGESVGIDEQVGTINLINSILSIISLFVAAVMIFIVTYVDLNNRRRLIGIERAIGITAASIQLSYVIKTIVAAIIGIALGSVLYLLVLIPLSQTMPFRFPSGPVSLVPQHGLMLRYGGLLLLSAIVATLIPTWYTLRAKLVEVIWGR